MKRILLPSLLLALPALAFAQGALTPPAGAFSGGAPTATMKTLDQVEPRTPIGKVGGSTEPIVITKSGSYVLLGDLSVTSGGAITIQNNDDTAINITIDLNGFKVSASGTAIWAIGTFGEITVRNGIIEKASDGIARTGTVRSWHVSDLTVLKTDSDAISLSPDNSTVSRCTVCETNGDGIAAAVIDHCLVYNCYRTALSGAVVTNSFGDGNDAGIVANTVINSSGKSLGGIGIDTTDHSNPVDPTKTGTAENCVGVSFSGIGLKTGTATNCTGHSTSGTGLEADNATNCRGTSSLGVGLDTNSGANGYTGTATGCTGISDSDHGLIASVATNCTGLTTDKSKIAVWVSGTATGCRGTNTGATGTGAQSAISCTIAVACTATTGTINAGSKQLGTP